MTNKKTEKQKNRQQTSCSGGNVRISREQSSGNSNKIVPSLKRNHKISFDSADTLAEEIAKLRDKNT